MPRPTIDILFSTFGQGIESIPLALLPPTQGINYIISHQIEHPIPIPHELVRRTDVEIHTIIGRGLAHNRNNALAHSKSDICIIADDDNRYTLAHIQTIISAYQQHPEADIICFQAQTYDGTPLKNYPQDSMPYTEAVRHGYYPSSIDLTMRRTSIRDKIAFNPNFGLGAPILCAGEEEVFMTDALRNGLRCLYINKVIAQTATSTTGQYFLTNPNLQLTKGAVFRYRFGYICAHWRALCESLWWFVHRRANPVPLLARMIKGINLKL